MKKINAFITERLKLDKNSKVSNKNHFLEWLKYFLNLINDGLKDNSQHINDSNFLINNVQSLLANVEKNEMPLVTCFQKNEASNEFTSNISIYDLDLGDEIVTQKENIDEIYLNIFDNALVVEIWYNKKMKYNTKDFIISFNQNDHDFLCKDFKYPKIPNMKWNEIQCEIENYIIFKKIKR